MLSGKTEGIFGPEKFQPHQHITRPIHILPVKLILCLFLLWAPFKALWADSASYAFIKENLGMTLAGVATSIAVHELGHFVVAEIEGVDAHFDEVTVRYNGLDGTERQRLLLSSAGFQAQWLLSEYAFYKLDQPDICRQKKALNMGFVLGQVAISAAYLSVLRDHEDGDVEGVVDASGLSSGEMLTILAVPALLDSWRLFDDNAPKWASWVSKGVKAVGISAVWTF